MKYVWDHAKVRDARGFGLADAAAIFGGRRVEWRDVRRDYGEVRMITVGRVGETFYTVVYCDRDGARRLIIAWRPDRKERSLWFG